MLARGFTVICLLVALLGMFAAIRVAEADRPRAKAGEAVFCVPAEKTSCAR